MYYACMPEQHRNRKRVQLTIDPVIWERCKAASAIAGPALSWSQVAEVSFSILLDQIDLLRDEVFSKLRPDATPDEISAMMRAHLARQIHTIEGDAYAQIEADLKQPPEPPKRGRRAS